MTAIYSAYLAVMSITAFILYGVDKSKAKKKKWRIKEKTLLISGICGGAYGAIAGMIYFHHKTRKPLFWTVNIIGAVMHIYLLYLLLK
ncbi:MAG: DUF1294 domain-containing protein [Ruminococcus sp.]|nr:DUF1294 domain-containing protein [Ruminococcus sp.]